MQMRLTLFGVVILGCLQRINGQDDNFSIDVKQRNAEVYHEQSMKNNEFNYGYQVEKENSQFQHKAKGPDDVTYGCYGYIDPNNEKHLYYYVADRLGYRLVAPDQPTKIFSERVANSINKLNEDLKGKGNLDERVVAWNDLYLPDSCRRLNEILTITTAAPVIKGFNGTAGGAVAVSASSGGAPANSGYKPPIATATVNNVPAPTIVVQTTAKPIQKPVITATASIGNLLPANIPKVIPNSATIPRPIATATVTVGNSTYKASSASASIGNIPPVIAVPTTPYPIPKPVVTVPTRPPVTQAPIIVPNLPTIPITSTTPQGKVPPVLSEPVRPPTIQLPSTTPAPITSIPNPGYTYTVPPTVPNLDSFGPSNPHLGPFNGYVYPIHGGCPASEANMGRLLTQMETLNDKVIELSANIRNLQGGAAAPATCQSWLNRQDQFPLIVYVPILLPYVNAGEVPSKSSFNPASYAFQKMCKEECK
ncbi:uncharacterized protein LOC120420853 [Culex pipiens pallens]|uniref:uncharacterized protein LOC120420853 n=1 Tax=Culex pipiens pallens TaxID=42434 RepID=UPI0019537E8D|nr:uncharacterized protein LOC120420853 [Culex pipiens pallens]